MQKIFANGLNDSIRFSESFNGTPKINEPCDENKSLLGVHRSGLGQFDIIYTGLMYGIQSQREFKEM